MTFAFDALPFAPAWLCLLAPVLLCIGAAFLFVATWGMVENPLWGLPAYMVCAPAAIIFWLLAGADAVGCSIFIWSIF